MKVDEAEPQASRGGSSDTELGQRPASTSRSRAERICVQALARVHAVRVADKLSYNGCRKAAIFVALLDPRDREICLATRGSINEYSA